MVAPKFKRLFDRLVTGDVPPESEFFAVIDGENDGAIGIYGFLKALLVHKSNVKVKQSPQLFAEILFSRADSVCHFDLFQAHHLEHLTDLKDVANKYVEIIESEVTSSVKKVTVNHLFLGLRLGAGPTIVERLP